MCRKVLAFSVLIFLVIAVPLSAQNRSTDQQSGPTRLQDWLGSWVSGTGGFTCERFGDAAVVCRSHWRTDTGDEGQGLYVNRWDAEGNVFRAYRFYDTGETGSGYMWVDGDTWTSVMEGPEGSRDKTVWTVTDEVAEYELYRSVRGGPWEFVYATAYTRAREGG